MSYKRRADYADLPLAAKLGILQYEVEIATTDEERSSALAAVERMKTVIEKLTPRPAKQDPSLPLGFTDMNK